MDDFIAGSLDGDGLEKNIYIANRHKFAPEYLARISQHGNIILVVLFKHPLVIKELSFLSLIPVEKICSLGLAHLTNTIILDVWNRANVFEIL
jgi:hypothetical protein